MNAPAEEVPVFSEAPPADATCTLWLGNLDPRVDRRLLYEIGIQARGAAVGAPGRAGSAALWQ